MAVVSGSVTKSGITSLPVKVQRARYDQNVQATPGIMRTGDHGNLGKFSSPFDDMATETFVSQPLIAGTGLPSGSRYISQLVASPNTYPTLTVEQSSHVSALDSKTFYLSGTTKENFKGFNDSRVHVVATGTTPTFFSQGTSEQTLPGFSSPLGSKVQLVFDMPVKQDRVLGRWSGKAYAGTEDAKIPNSEFGRNKLTGFCYYNFEKGGWEQIGLVDPATGKDIHNEYAAEVKAYGGGGGNSFGAKSWLIKSGTNNYPLQFRPPIANQAQFTFLSASSNGMNKVGLPTIANLAPFKTTYHATSSQTIRLTGSISHPFLLEKAVFEAPFTARHKYDEFDTKAWLQDNYTFFMYRQVRAIGFDGINDTAVDVSGSTRFIVASASLAVYNSQARMVSEKPDGSAAVKNVTGFAPTNTPAQSFNLGVTVDGSNPAAGTVSEIEGVMRLEIVPAVAPAQDLGFSVVPNSSVGQAPGSLANVIPVAQIEHMWPGGTTSSPFFQGEAGEGTPSIYTGKAGVSASYAFTGSHLLGRFVSNPRTFLQFPESHDLQAFFGDLPIQTFDARSINPLGGTPTTFKVISVDGSGSVKTPEAETGGENAVTSPYLLFPEDELVFGFDAGIGQSMRQTFEQPQVLTSSILTLKAGSAKLTLFGSMISRAQEYYPTTNQPLNTVEIQEALHYDNPVVDQFMIERDEVFTGSNQEETIGGGYGITRWDANFGEGVGGDRRVIGTRSRGTMGTTGSLQRFDRLHSQNETFKDTRIKNSAVYRYDHFGHVRDLLEPLTDGSFRVNKSDKSGLVDPPIFVKFVKDGEQTAPENTHSQNLSTYATSSLVYVDRPDSTLENPVIGQDRSNNPDVSLDEQVEIE